MFNFYINVFLETRGLDKNNSILLEQKKALKKDYEALKKDIGGRGLELSKKTKYTNKLPILGVQIKEFPKEELEVDRAKAVEWAVDKELLALLDIDDEKYQKQLETGVFKEQPGKIKKFSEYRAYISLKTYQEEK